MALIFTENNIVTYPALSILPWFKSVFLLFSARLGLRGHSLPSFATIISSLKENSLVKEIT
jgi:hypothetical protein